MSDDIADIQANGQDVVIRLHTAEVDTDQLRGLVADLRQLLADAPARTFTFCCGKVEFLPSACLALLLMFHQEVRQAGGKIVLLNCQENVAFLMRLARLDAVFELDEGNPPEIPPASPPEG